MNTIQLESRLPTPEEFSTLRVAVGWGIPARAALERGLAGSVYGVCAVDDGVVVGTGRIIGDGGFTYFLGDIMVAPHYRSLGIGTAITDRLLRFVRAEADPTAYITLMAAKGVEGFYERFGFVSRPDDRYGAGMILPPAVVAQWIAERSVD